jgi:hypothetical protein
MTSHLTVASRNSAALRDLPPAERDAVVMLTRTRERLEPASDADLVTGLEYIFRTRRQRDKGEHEMIGDVQLYLAGLRGCSARAWRRILDAVRAGRLDDDDEGIWVPTIAQLVKVAERIDEPERVKEASLVQQAEHLRKRRELEERCRKDTLALERSRQLYSDFCRRHEEERARARALEAEEEAKKRAQLAAALADARQRMDERAAAATAEPAEA